MHMIIVKKIHPDEICGFWKFQHVYSTPPISVGYGGFVPPYTVALYGDCDGSRHDVMRRQWLRSMIAFGQAFVYASADSLLSWFRSDLCMELARLASGRMSPRAVAAEVDGQCRRMDLALSLAGLSDG